MSEPAITLSDMAWPLAVLGAWLAGEYMNRWTKLPRISAYAIAGFLLAPTQTGFLPSAQSPSMLLAANIAFGLFLFECGYRINLNWLRANPWIGATSLAETLFTFGVVYLVAIGFRQPTATALLLAALSIATSPAIVVRIVNETRSSGQVTERVLHLAALNCAIAVVVFKLIVGHTVLESSGDLWKAMSNSVVVVLGSLLLGALLGVMAPAVLRSLRRTSSDSTLAFAIAVICLVALAHSLKLSPVLAALTFGVATRHYRIVLSPTQRGFGILGDLLSVLLFVFIAATLDWHQVVSGLGLGAALLLTRQLAKVFGTSVLGRISGLTWRKAGLVGMASAPLSAFVILILEQTRYLGIDLVDRLAPLATAALTMEVLGPILTRQALVWASEVPDRGEA